MNKVKEVKKDVGDANSGRGSVSSAIAKFQTVININSGRGKKPVESDQKVNKNDRVSNKNKFQHNN